jgi:hypothetical protein
MTTFSIIIPLFNKAKYVASALQSLIPQLAPGDEIVVVDDQSTDDSRDIVAALSRDNVRLIQLLENDGPATARNAGAAQARGEYLLFFDADDLPHPQMLTVMRQCIAQHPHACVFAFNLATQARGEVIDLTTEINLTNVRTQVLARHAFVRSCLQGRPICTASSTCVRAGEFLAAGGFLAGLRYCEDPEFWARLSALHDIVHIDACLALYRDVPMSMSYGLRAQPGAVQPYVNTLLSLASHLGDPYHRLARSMIVKNVVFGMIMGASRTEILDYLVTTERVLPFTQRIVLQFLVLLPRQVLRFPFQLRDWAENRRQRRNLRAGDAAV